ncbi:hypothetical protein [Mesorhizobium marinum]|uniref:Uncharacterized protein n=1 Tax=Mesorhizobium marinum TaxID=3228790 RepID=A0ABV3R120_9HYPH
MRTQQIRDILYLDCQVRSDPETSPLKSMEWIADKIVELAADKANTTYWSRDRRKKIYIRSHQVVGRVLWLLLYSNDADAPDASFAHLETDDQRDEAKAEGEGRPESAHIAISLDEVPKRRFRYLMMLEEAPTLPRARVERYFNHLLRQIKRVHPDDFSHPHPSGAVKDGQPVMQKYKNRVELLGHLSNKFRDDIEAGALRGIALETSSTERIGFGEGRRVYPVKKSIVLSARTTWSDAPLRTIGEAITLGKRNDLEVARISFSSADNTNHTALIDTDSGNVLNDGYIKKSRVSGIGVMLPEASVVISDRLQARMLRLLDDEMEALKGPQR